jgi:DNA polymerase elongation subunit (family B)
VLALFVRNGKQREMHIVKDFKPYFYVPSLELGEGFQAIDGMLVKKIYTKLPQDVEHERRDYDKHWEADVHFSTRYLIDCVPHIEKSELRVQYTDIEKDPASNRIISISVYDNYLQKCIAFAWREDLSESRKDTVYTFPSGYKFNASIHLYNSRVKMLQNYINFVKDTDPDILTGWFFVKYDAKELIQEINSVGLKASDLSPLHRAYIIGEEVSKIESNIAIKGRVLWDMLHAYSALQPGRLPDYSLESVAQKELGEGKHAHKPFSELWSDIEELVNYNCKDAVLVYRIDQKRHLLEYFDTLRRFVGCEWNSLFHETLLWDTYILRKLHNTLVLPSKNRRKSERFKGARVLQPISKGIHRNIILIDLKSLYPSIIITFNMSPETLVKNNDYNNCYKLPNGIAFKKGKIGIVPEVLLELMKLRVEFKTEMKKYPFGVSEYESLYQQQEAIKILLNALYGALAYENFRLVTPEIASAIPYVGRHVLEFIVKEVQDLGFKVLYGDTDSIFICANSDVPKESVRQMLSICEHLNASLPKFAKDFGNADNCTIRIEPKKIYKSLMISEKKSGEVATAKKRYGGIIMWANNEYIDMNSEKALEIMGFESKRSDSSAFSRELQKKVIRMLLEGKSKTDLKLYIEGCINSISGKDIDYEYVGIPKGLSQSLESYKTDNPHRRAALYSNKYLGMKFGIADKPKILYVRATGKYPRTDVVAFSSNEDLPSDFKMDVDTMIDKSIRMKIEHILDAANLDFNEILHPSSKLSEFI